VKKSEKKCSEKYGCGKIKPVDNFQFRKDSGKYRNTCKECDKKRISGWRKDNPRKVQSYSKKWRDKNPEYMKEYRKENLERLISYEKEYYEENKIWISEKNKTYRKNNEDEIKKRKKIYYEKNKDIINKKQAKKIQQDIQLRIKHSLRNRTRLAIKNGQKAGSAVRDLGCSVEELKGHLEKKFRSGMTWDNYGEWHIDHIKPLSSFNLTDREQFLRACHYTNLQPLWAEENLSKGAKIP
jgi:hypothetical protein